jgi:hypothetical protein
MSIEDAWSPMIQLLRACVNVILAEHDQPEPSDDTDIKMVVELLNAIAEHERLMRGQLKR